jgi:hypothetical protein
MLGIHEDEMMGAMSFTSLTDIAAVEHATLYVNYRKVIFFKW